MVDGVAKPVWIGQENVETHRDVAKLLIAKLAASKLLNQLNGFSENFRWNLHATSPND